MHKYDLLGKVERALVGCETTEQLVVAKEYAHLACRLHAEDITFQNAIDDVLWRAAHSTFKIGKTTCV